MHVRRYVPCAEVNNPSKLPKAPLINMNAGHPDRAPVAQLVEHRAVTREVVSSTPAGPTLRVFK